jgi:hypothetical protein
MEQMTKQDRVDDNELRQALAHVLWIGGGPNAGRTSVAAALVEKYGLQLYSYDEHAEDHWLNHVSQDPDSFGYNLMQLPVEERWLQPPEMQMHSVLRIVEDDFPLVLDDLLAMSRERPIIVEGNIPPGLVAPLLTTKQQAIWMVASDEFYQASFYRRKKHLGHNDKRDSEQTRANHMARDRLFTKYIKEEAVARGFELLEIDGSRSLKEVVRRVRDHFAMLLDASGSD